MEELILHQKTSYRSFKNFFEMHFRWRFRLFIILTLLIFIFWLFFHFWKIVISNFNQDIIKPSFDQDIFKKAKFPIKSTYALVFYGRKSRVSILIHYLMKNLKINGGILDKIVFAENTSNKDDLEYLDSIIKNNTKYFYRLMLKGGYKQLYTAIEDDDLVFKIDDDIVFISNGTFERMLEEYFLEDHLIMSANVVNHPLLSHVHARMKAILPYYEVGNFTWAKSHNETNLDNSECKKGNYDPHSNWWGNPKCAAIVHENFLHHGLNKKIDNYNFKYWDFHQMGYERWSINFVLTRGLYVNKIPKLYPNEIEDEVVISKNIPEKYQRHSIALGSAIVVHFSYFVQLKYLENTTLLSRYERFSKSYLNLV